MRMEPGASSRTASPAAREILLLADACRQFRRLLGRSPWDGAPTLCRSRLWIGLGRGWWKRPAHGAFPIESGPRSLGTRRRRHSRLFCGGHRQRLLG